MMASVIIRKRVLLGTVIILTSLLCIKLARITIHERAQVLAVLPSLAEDPGRSFCPPSKQGCSHETTDAIVPSSAPCAGIPTDSRLRVQIVLKTGASERDKTKTFLSTLLACSPEVPIVSDVKDEIDGHRIIDILADLPSSYSADNPDWSIYESQKEALSKGQAVPKSHDGWKLDRYKFLPMVEKAFEMNPDADWYFFVEIDTYFFWDTLYRLLDRLDSNERHYIGAAVGGANSTFFGYGGAGMILSSGLMSDLLQGRTESLSTKYEHLVRSDCCGDAVLAYVIREELGLRIENAHPTMSGEELSAVGVGKENWNTPLLSLHRVGPELMERLWRWERCRPYDEKPVSFATILDFTLSPILRSGSSLTRWDNLSSRQLRFWSTAHSSVSACAQHCMADEKCLQWAYSNYRCRVDEHVKQGRIADDSVTSGWDLLKLERLGHTLNKVSG